MVNRVKFLPNKQKTFLLEIQNKSGLSTEGLANIAGITPRSYRDWKRGKLNMDFNTVLKFSNRFDVILPEDVFLMEKRWREYKSAVAVRGGVACYKKYGNPSTIEGRRKGGAQALSILRERGVIPPKKLYSFPTQYCEKLAEYVGAILGDGGLSSTQLQITLNSIKDKDYALFLRKTGRKLFGEEPKMIKKKNQNALCLYYNGVSLSNYLVNIGLKIGNKIKLQVDVPSWIKSERRYRIACLRGLMDTDGGVFIHRYEVNNRQYSYKKICFTNYSVPLLSFVKETLEELGFTPKIITRVENKKVWLYNEQEVKSYMTIVGSHNERLLKPSRTYSGGVR